MARYRLMEWLNFISSELHKRFSPLNLTDYMARVQARPPVQAAMKAASIRT